MFSHTKARTGRCPHREIPWNTPYAPPDPRATKDGIITKLASLPEAVPEAASSVVGHGIVTKLAEADSGIGVQRCDVEALGAADPGMVRDIRVHSVREGG